jgi:predicted RNase H-like HicB family nuclease
MNKMKDYHINIFYSDDDGGYIADIPDLVSCSAFGNTPEEALREVLIAKEAWIEAAREEGKVIPVPVYRSGMKVSQRYEYSEKRYY